MRVQLEGQSLRVRLKESEFQELLDDRPVENRTHFPDGRQVTQRIQLGDAVSCGLDGDHWEIRLPGAALQDYRDQLPTRDGLDFALDTPSGELRIRFDVDIRDSVRRRYPPKPHKSEP